MADEETLKRILEIAREGRAMMERARVEAERRVARAREDAAAAAKRAREDRSRALLEEFASIKSAVDAEFGERLEEFRKSLDSAPVDREAFRSLVSALIREGSGAGAGR